MSATLEFSSFRFRDHEEFCLRAGSHFPNQILFIPPLFDEMNRMRQILVQVMEQLELREIGTLLPDLPGSNESLFPQDRTDLSIWREALTACKQQFSGITHIAGLRGGCLIDDFDPDTPIWRLSPIGGSQLLRTMMRTRIAADKEAGMSSTLQDLTDQAADRTLNLAGNMIGSPMFAQLQEAHPADLANVRTVRLSSDSKGADARIAGSALWLRAEPDSDPDLTAALVEELCAWVRS